MKATIDVRSEEGEGTLFTVHLPVRVDPGSPDEQAFRALVPESDETSPVGAARGDGAEVGGGGAATNRAATGAPEDRADAGDGGEPSAGR